MDDQDINVLMQAGWWVSVSPVVSQGEWVWTCGIYKKGKKTGNWVTEDCRTHSTPEEAYDWAREILYEKVKPILN